MVGYRVDLFRAGMISSYDSFTLVASGDDEAISEARIHAPIGRPDSNRFTVVKMRGKNSRVIFDSSQSKNF